jgi:hypothetical protein
LAGTLLFDEKIRQSAALFWFGWQDAGFFTHEPYSKEQLMSLPHFWSTVGRKRSQFEHMQTGIQTSRRLDSFFHEAAQNFKLLSNIQGQK